MREVADQQLF